jgi:hypothetical protein
MKGYKGFDKDLKCKGFQYEVGKTYECEGKITLCVNGFHFCKEPKQIYGYYADLPACRYCEIEASGEIIEGDGKCVCSEIKIVREIPLQEFLSLVNEGSRNSGWSNKGDCNKGDCNEGDGNKGDCNKGDSNEGNGNKGDSNEGNGNKGDSNEGNGNKGDSNKGNSNVGDCNKGDCNEGDCNKGNCNKGDWNKGDCNEGNSNEGDSNEGNGNVGNRNKGNWNVGNSNKGDRNIGSYNRADGACGIFNTGGGCVIFNRYTPMKHIEIEKTDGYRYLASCVAMRREPTEDELAEIRKLPNFDENVMNELIFGKGDKK